MTVNNSLSKQELESYLWGAAVFLRNKIDPGDYKGYIFPLLFLKRISDVYDEEYQKALSESNTDIEYALSKTNHMFQVSSNSHWNELRKTSKNIGQKILEIMRAIEKSNPMLFGIFGDANWSNKERLSDETLSNLIDHFSKKTLSLENIPNDEMGFGYEYLIKKFADDSGHTAAEFYTNRTLVNLMTRILDPTENESIYDPTCGTGGMLLESVNHLERNNREFRNIKLFGQEKNAITSGIARMNMFLHGIEDFEIKRGDTLSDPLFVNDDRLKKFNCILANPPYSISKWNQKNWQNDPYGRNIYGVPPQSRADYAFLQHIVKSLDEKNGRAAILFPHGVLFRDEEHELRKKLIEHDVIESIIGLGPNLFYNSPMEACVMILKSSKTNKRKNKILFINGINEITKVRGQSHLSEENIQKILSTYKNFNSLEKFSYLADLSEIIDNNYILSIPIYAMPHTRRQFLPITEASGQWQNDIHSLSNSFTSLFKKLETL